ncbi:threonine/homoserine efflux transporter RhtA [Aminobacter aminovorans]|uniref:Probable amino-acid metabolite efflux pump n=1 Tax=Aminobacter aminovorans TaxID=83263 RepID=A0A380WNQ2_AMIAI|nr:EamA family transporter [Aminobacter aminovorans]TCS29764.1 threonine/homoserine efflux transporter RhtA [Aminobacter aminovorans]SUU90613.1 Probable amino-acid metabolite efflux pump [Aminobacter aminovorans]
MTAQTTSRSGNPTQRASAVTVLAVVVTIFGWASSFPAIRAGLSAIDPIELGALRFAIAAVPSAIYLMILRPALPSLNELWRFAFGGAVFIALYTVLLNYGEMTVSAGAASFIINVNPIITAVLAMILLGERFPVLAWIGTFLSFAGIGIIALGEGQGLTFNTGALLILGSALCTSLASIVQKRLYSRHRPLTVSAWNMILGALFLAPALPNGLAQMSVAAAEPFWSVIYLGIVPSLIAYGSWSVALSRLPASRASNFMYCVPPVAVAIGFFWLGETPGLFGILGGALALAGVVLVNLKR